MRRLGAIVGAYAIALSVPALAADSPVYPEDQALAEARGSALGLADACEIELQNPPQSLPVCNRFREAIAFYLRSLSRKAGWCADQLERGFAPSLAECPDPIASNDDPLFVRSNGIMSRFGRPPIHTGPQPGGQ